MSLDPQRQLTLRAAFAGAILGGAMCLSNLYTALTIGWSFGVAITSGVLAWAIFALLLRLRIVRTAFGILENNAMQSVASCAGYMVGGGTTAAIPALMMINAENGVETTLTGWQLFAWITTIALLGVVMAIPMKQQMINVEQLRFPSGIAAAETLKALHAGEEGRRQSGLLGRGAIAGVLVGFFREAHASWIPWNLPQKLNFKLGAPLELLPASWRDAILGTLSEPTRLLLDAEPHLRSRPLSKYTFYLDTSIILAAAGAIMGWRAAWGMMLGAVINYLILGPIVFSRGIVLWDLGYKNMATWSVWFGSSLLLTSSLTAFFFQWRSVVAAIKSVFAAFKSKADDLANQEVPMSWFVIGVAIFGPMVVGVEYAIFGIKPWLGVVSVILAFFIAIVASRVTGETDTTPSGALGKVTQITFGVLDPGNATTNLMTANVTGGVGLHAADLLTDLKSGYVLKADPRQQFWAQFIGVLAGGLFVVPAWDLLITGPEVFGTKYPAPGAIAWKGVAQMLSQGIEKLHPSAQLSILVGATLGIALALLDRRFPQYKKWIPSASGVGLGFTTPGANTISMFIGALIALWIARKDAKADETLVPVSSGVIAGESLTAVFVMMADKVGVFDGTLVPKIVALLAVLGLMSAATTPG